MSLEQTWRDRAAAIREQAQPLQARIAEARARMKTCSEFEGEQLLRELSALTNRLGQLARDANLADESAREHAEANR